MKKLFLKPGFEFIFSLSLIVILGLPPVLMAQSQKDLEIKIENGDTTINGKNIKDLSAADRKSALNDINHLRGGITINRIGDGKNGMHFYSFKHKSGDTAGHKFERMEFRKQRMGEGEHEIMQGNVIMKDSMGNVMFRRQGKPGGMGTMMTFKHRMGGEMDDNMEPGDRNFRMPVIRFEHRNSQHFNYVNTDKDGISTRLNISVSEASRPMLKEIARVEEANLEIKDLNIVPEFTSGKMVLMFSLPAKTPAEVKFKDSEGKVIWSDKSAGAGFTKSFPLALNGIYYLQVKQGNDVTLKKIVKEE